MKTASARDLQKQAATCIESAQKGPVVITRYGQPVAVLTGTEGLDWEDLYYMTSPRFWKEIERRRGRPTLSHEEVWQDLDEEEEAGEDR
jgi:prevent-host-death family protein